MCLEDLAVLVLQHRGEGSVQHARSARHERGPVPSALEPFPARLDPDQLDVVVEEGAEGADRVAAAADAGNHAVGEAADLLDQLGASLVPDHALEVTYERWIWSRTDSRADYVVRRLDVGHPVADRRADRF